MKEFRLDPEDLAWSCDPALFEFDTTAELPCLDDTIGQERALLAIEFGLGMSDPGYNIFILGEPGTGRTSTIKKLLARHAATLPVPDDWCYVFDFNDSTRPKHLNLPAGRGKCLEHDVELLVSRLAVEIPKIFESKTYEQKKFEITNIFKEKNRLLFQDMEEAAKAEGFVLQRTEGVLALVPTRDGQALSQQSYDELAEDVQHEIDQRGNMLQGRLNEAHRMARELEKELFTAISTMERDELHSAVEQLFLEMEVRYGDIPKVQEHFVACRKHIESRLDEFRPDGPEPGQDDSDNNNDNSDSGSFDIYRVNLLLDNSELSGAPVICEANPTYFNLFGRIEHLIQMGNASTNFSLIKAGAVHRANGGFLLLDVRELLFNPFSYEALKRAVRNREVRMEDMVEQNRLFATVSLKPEPIPLKCKIILIGTPELYALLQRHDPDFRKYFKVRADFDETMRNTWENVGQYAHFVAAKCNEEGLLPFTRDGVARLVEYSARLSDDKRRLSSSFLDVADLIREASFYAGRAGATAVQRGHVDLAVAARTYRCNISEERIQELLTDGTLLIETDGRVVGQVNGLTVYQSGDYAFGRPARVTAKTCLGRNGVVNIEREVKLSGPLHDKGVLILSGFLGDRYAQEKPLTLSATICFEQSYGGIEGDSASSAELYALLSSLSGIALRQDIAVTGSVDQRGQIQPIGGVNEKIEGFFAVCNARGLTGQQGVIIPVQNVQNLMLRDEVIAAVREERFHVWAIATIDQGLEILTGLAAGTRTTTGAWPEGSLNALVDRRLQTMSESLRRFSLSPAVSRGSR